MFNVRTVTIWKPENQKRMKAGLFYPVFKCRYYLNREKMSGFETFLSCLLIILSGFWTVMFGFPMPFKTEHVWTIWELDLCSICLVTVIIKLFYNTWLKFTKLLLSLFVEDFFVNLAAGKWPKLRSNVF